MLTEVLVKAALEAVVGHGFKAVVERVFSKSRGKSDRQILEAVLLEVHHHGGKIYSIDSRLSQLEFEVAKLQTKPFSGEYPETRAITQVRAPESGEHFSKTSGGSMNHFKQLQKK